MAIIAMIGGVDVSEYLKELEVTPGGDGIVGSARLYLDQEAGGLDIRPMDLVQVWVPHTGSSGIAAKGRLFGGHVNVRDTGNIGTTKTWALNCWDHNILLHKIVRDRQAAKAVVLTADDFDAQIATLIQQIQRNGGGSVNKDITTEVAMSDPMPAVTYPGGKKLGWYVQQLCEALHVLEPTIFPRFYMGTATTFGIGDNFGNPVLSVYDGALLPTSTLSFSDVVAGGRKPIFGTFKRVTDATAMSQRRQSRWGEDTVVTSDNDTSQSTYPNEYINHGEDPGGNSGYWMNEALEDRESISLDDAQARLDAIVAAESNPRETFEFETPERVLPGETIGLGWTLEGIADDTEYTVAKVQTVVEPPDVLWSKLTVNARRLGLFENNLSVFAAPIEGDDVPPLGIDNLAATTAYDPVAGQSWVHLTWDQSLSPDAAYNKVYIMQAGTVIQEVILDDLYTQYSYLTPPSTAYQATVSALDRAGNESDPFLPPVSGTSAAPFTDTPLNPSFEEEDLSDATLPRYWERDVNGNATAVRDNTEHSSGDWSVLLTHGTGATSDTAGIQQKIHISGGQGEEWVFGVHAMGDAGKEVLTVRAVVVDESDTPILSEQASYPMTTDWRWYTVSVVIASNLAHSVYLSAHEDDVTTSAKKIYVDAVDWNPAGSEIREGVLTQGQAHTVANASDQISLIDRARMASGWRNLGLLTNDAFREACIVYWDGDYYVFSTQVYETDLTRVHVASTLEGIVSATPTNNLAAVKYPSVVHDQQTGIWHLYGSHSALTDHYISLSPTGPYTLSDTINIPIFDGVVARHPVSGKWYAIGFQNGVWTLHICVADAPEGPWTDLGDPFADVGQAPFALTARPDPGFAFTGNRDYIFFSGAPSTVLTQNYFPSICEVNLETGRVVGVPLALLDEREEWMVGGESLPTRGISDLAFLRVPGEPDRIFAWANDGEVSTTDDWGWGCLELEKTIAPTDGRKHTDLVRIDFERGIDKAFNVRPVTRAGTGWRDNSLVITADDGGAHGYVTQQYIEDFTMYADFTVDGPQAANAMVGVILGPTYTAGPAITIDLDAMDIRAVVQASDDTAVVLTSGITTVPGRRYRVMLRRASDVVTLWVDGVLVDTDTLDPVITDARIWSMGAYITFTEPEVYPFIGTIHDFWCTGQAVPMQELAVYAPPAFLGARYKTDAGQSIPNVTATIIDFEDQDYDTYASVTTGATWKFTAPIAGFYRVCAMITFVATSNWALPESGDLDLYKNGTRVCNLDRNDNVANANVIKTLSGCTEIYLVAGDYIDLRAFQQSGASLALIAASENCYVTVSRMN